MAEREIIRTLSEKEANVVRRRLHEMKLAQDQMQAAHVRFQRAKAAADDVAAALAGGDDLTVKLDLQTMELYRDVGESKEAPPS